MLEDFFLKIFVEQDNPGDL